MDEGYISDSIVLLREKYRIWIVKREKCIHLELANNFSCRLCLPPHLPLLIKHAAKFLSEYNGSDLKVILS
jgi:hypothetical protein